MNIDIALQNRLQGKVLVVGVGQPSQGDDAAGLFLIKKIQPTDLLKTMAVAESPEFFLTEIAQTSPDVVMFADAAELSSLPGSVAIVEREQLSRLQGQTHRPPLSAVAEVVATQTGADTFLLAIQPLRLSGDDHLSPDVEASIRALSEIINRISGGHGVQRSREE